MKILLTIVTALLLSIALLVLLPNRERESPGPESSTVTGTSPSLLVPDDRPPTAEKEDTSTPAVQNPMIEVPWTMPTETVLLDVPFTSQAPYGQWSDRTYQDGCEEAALLMAARYMRGARGGTITPDDATRAIAQLSDYARDTYGYYLDIAAPDVVRLAEDFYRDILAASYVSAVTREDIVRALTEGHPVILPMDGRALNNPNFTNGGPERHALLVVGYEPATDTFITNDPGTRNGRHYRYSTTVLMGAIREYTSGDHAPIPVPTIRSAVVITPR